MDLKKEVINELWNKDSYYQQIKDAQAAENPDSTYFFDLIADEVVKNQCASILDVGCGEGSAIECIQKKVGIGYSFTGIDVTPIAVERAKERNLANTDFILYDGGALPFNDSRFDLSFSTFVFEHLSNPEEVFREMVRVTKPGGIISIACPNYGSPFFRSPCNKENKLKLMIKRLFQGFGSKGRYKNSFNWNKVDPIILNNGQHIMDYDTLVEPNLLFFKKYSKNNFDFTVKKFDSGWNKFKYGGGSLAKGIFLNFIKFLGLLNAPFIKYYGPFFFIVIRKKL